MRSIDSFSGSALGRSLSMIPSPHVGTGQLGTTITPVCCDTYEGPKSPLQGWAPLASNSIFRTFPLTVGAKEQVGFGVAEAWAESA